MTTGTGKKKNTANKDKNNCKSKIEIKQSASKLLCLTRYLGLMIGDLINDKSEYWDLYLIHRKIIGLITSPNIPKYKTYLLKDMIQQHHLLYFKLFGNLKPKLHF